MKKLIAVSILLVAWMSSYAQNITAQEAFAMVDAANFNQAATKLKTKGYKYQNGCDYTTAAGVKVYEYGYKCCRGDIAYGRTWTIDFGVKDWTYVHLLVEPYSNKLCAMFIGIGSEKRFLSYKPVLNARGYELWQEGVYGANYTNKNKGGFVVVKSDGGYSVEIKNKYMLYANTELKKYESGGDGNPAYFPGIIKYLESHRRQLQIETTNPDFSTTVDVEFVVERDGSVTNIKTNKFMFNPLGMAAAEEVERVFSSMPKWIPAHEHSVAERVLVKLVIPFGKAARKVYESINNQ